MRKLAVIILTGILMSCSLFAQENSPQNNCDSRYVRKIERMHKYRFVRGAAVIVGVTAVVGATVLTGGGLYLLYPSINLLILGTGAVGTSGGYLVYSLNRRSGIINAYSALSLVDVPLEELDTQTKLSGISSEHVRNAIDALRCNYTDGCKDYETTRLLLKEYKSTGEACKHGIVKTLAGIARQLF